MNQGIEESQKQEPAKTLIPRKNIHLGRLGIKNPINGCSLITALNVLLLSHIPHIVKYLIDYYLSNYKENDTDEDKSFPYAISKLMWCLWATGDTKTISKLLLIIIDNLRISAHQSKFNGLDAVEWLNMLISGIENIHYEDEKKKLERLHGNNSSTTTTRPVVDLSTTTYNPESIKILWDSYKDIAQSEIRKSLYGMMYTVHSCSNCKMHYQFELFNTIHIPLVIEDEYITITKIEYKTQIKGKKVPYHPELTLFKCRVNTDLDCTSLYDQMAMSLGKRTTDFDILLYKRDTRDIQVINPQLQQSKLYPFFSTNYLFLCTLKPAVGMKPLAIQPVVWRYVMQKRSEKDVPKRSSSFIAMGFPFITYCYPTNTFSGLFQEFTFFLNSEYRYHMKLFQDRLKYIMQLVYFDIVRSQKRSKPSGEEAQDSPENIPLFNPLSWVQFPPYLPVINAFYYKAALKKHLNTTSDPEVQLALLTKRTENWLRYVFRKDHLNKKVKDLIAFNNYVQMLYIVMDVDEGEVPLTPNTLGEYHHHYLKNQEKMSVAPTFTAELSDFDFNASTRSPTITLEYCIEQYVKMKDAEQAECNYCRKEEHIERCVFFYSLPRYLFLHLQRAAVIHERNEFIPRKVITNVSYPIKGLDLSAYYTPEKRSKSGCLYDLLGVICHTTSPGEHFYVICKDDVEGEPKWIRYNDSEVEYIREDEVVTNDAYQLIYVKRNQKYITGEKIREFILQFAE